MEIELENGLTQNIDLKESISGVQNNFLQSSWGKAINNAVDIGLKVILPDFIEDEIVDIKNAFVKGGLKEGIQTAIDTTINKGKEITGIFTGDLENMTQAEAIAKNGGLIKNISSSLKKVIKNTVDNDLLEEGLSNIIEAGKDTILDYAERNIDKVNKEQVEKIKEMETAIKNWDEAFQKQDFNKMQKEYKKIHNRIEKIMPIKEIIEKAEVVENLHNLIKNNGKNFDLTEEQIQLAQQLI